MRIVVCVKQVVDPLSIRISRSREELDLREARRVVNPADRYAMEAGLRLREVTGGQMIALTAGDEWAEDAARWAIAMGADEATLIVGDACASGGLAVVRTLGTVIKKSGAELVLTGDRGGYEGDGALPAQVAAHLGWPVFLDIMSIEIAGGELRATSRRGHSAATGVVPLPAVVSITPGAGLPRFPHPRRIATAWDPGRVTILPESSLGLPTEMLAPRLSRVGLALQPERIRGQIVSGGPDAAARTVWDLMQARLR